MNSTVVYNQDVLEAFTSLVEHGPNVTKSVLMAFIEPANLLVELPLVQHFFYFIKVNLPVVKFSDGFKLSSSYIVKVSFYEYTFDALGNYQQHF